MALDPEDAVTLASLVDAIVPADATPSASATGVVEHVRAVLERERPDWAERLAAVLALVQGGDPAAALAAHADDPDVRWLTGLVVDAYWANPEDRAGRGTAAWDDLGWRRWPEGDRPLEPPVREHREAVIGPDALAERYDAVVVGSGAGGGVAAEALAASGRRVLVVEAGDWPALADVTLDHLRNPRQVRGLRLFSGPPLGSTRVAADGSVLPDPSDGRWSNNAMSFGGGTRYYGAQAWRLTPDDFRMRSVYGRPDGSDLPDWPFGYDELEPYYTRAEVEMGVSGSVLGDTSAGPRSRDYPMPPLPPGRTAAVLAEGAARLGWSTTAVPLLINSRPYDGRPACVQCAQCIGFDCPVQAKSGSHNSTLARALASASCRVLPSATVVRLLTDARGRVAGVRIAGGSADGVWRRDVAAGEVVLAGGAVETARLLLNSATEQEPDGIGNATDQVGRHLQGHLYGGAIGLFDEPVQDLVGPGPSIATCDFRHGNEGIVGGGMIANEFVPTPASAYHYLRAADLMPASGTAMKDAMRVAYPRMLRVVGPIQEVTSATSRVRVDPGVLDRFGTPVARLEGGAHPLDLRARAFLTGRAREWLEASGAATVRDDAVNGGGRAPVGPSGGQHQAGTCRMGDDPAASVTDPEGRVWGHENLRIADGSLHPTNGGVNPVLTILANAYRVMDRMLT
ncbi:MAG TPA: GMC family oxidoreductase [Amnibacterium sp.]